jgi:uncharacterized surface protein with fasciclin (FAS1) repeats
MKFGLLFIAAFAKTALDVVLESPIHKTLAQLAGTLPEVVEVLKSAGPLTLFAPTDAAFAKLSPEVVKAVTTDPTLLSNVLKYHVLAGSAFAPNAHTPARQFVSTAVGETLRVDVSQGLKVTLAFGLGSTTVSGSVQTSNGIVHVIPDVLIPPKSASATAVEAKLTKLVQALQSSKLVETVDGLKGVTIFAPLDKAFEALAKASKESDIEITPEFLTTILTTHVVPGVVYSTDIAKQKLIRGVNTVSGNKLDAIFRHGNVFVRGRGNSFPARVVVADVLLQNGSVVHVIDRVLLPEFKN